MTVENAEEPIYVVGKIDSFSIKSTCFQPKFSINKLSIVSYETGHLIRLPLLFYSLFSVAVTLKTVAN